MSSGRTAADRCGRPAFSSSVRGFSTVELILAASVIGMLALLAIPFYRRTQQAMVRSSCINNLRILSVSKEMYAIEKNAANGARITAEEIDLFLKEPFESMKEPGGGEYKLNVIGIDPVCSIGPPHVLP